MTDRTLKEELLADLRLAAPVPVAPPQAERPGTPTMQVRLTPLRWSRPRATAVRRPRPALELSAGPVQISLTGR